MHTCSDWGKGNEIKVDANETHDANIRKATHWMIYDILPAFANELQNSNVLLANPVSGEVHKRGINIR